MTKVTRHPNCRCATHVGDNPYCIIHGRIRNMDAGASPFVDADAVGAEIAEKLGIEEEDIDRTEQLDDVISRMHRDNMDRDIESVLEGSMNALKEFAEQDGPGCKCDYQMTNTGPRRHVNDACPLHGSGARQDYDVEGSAEEIE